MAQPSNTHPTPPAINSPHARSNIRLPSLDDDVFSSGFFPIATPEILGIGSNILQAQNIALGSMLQELRQTVSILREQHSRLLPTPTIEEESDHVRTLIFSSNDDDVQKKRTNETPTTKAVHFDDEHESRWSKEARASGSISTHGSRDASVSDSEDGTETGKEDDDDDAGEVSDINDDKDKGEDFNPNQGALKEPRDHHEKDETIVRGHHQVSADTGQVQGEV